MGLCSLPLELFIYHLLSLPVTDYFDAHWSVGKMNFQTRTCQTRYLRLNKVNKSLRNIELQIQSSATIPIQHQILPELAVCIIFSDSAFCKVCLRMLACAGV
jgi:hypothetical protein